MASFVLDAVLFGDNIELAKLVNLIIHLLCGLAMYAVLRRVIAYDTALSRRLHWLPALLAGIWLILPINVSTVLYLVQRMAMLSALFVLTGLWVFLWARKRIEDAKPGGHVALWLGVPTFTVLAMFSKENGALLPLLALAIEFGILRRGNSGVRSRSVDLFFLVSVVVPGLLLAALLLVRPETLLSGYAKRDFTMGERVLTQFRVLWDYVFTVLVPFSPKLGIYHDNYVRSNGLISPWSTLFAILAWLGVLAAAWRLRFVAPCVITGILFFLCGHAMESSVFPLEIYFEHRNYLPSMGLLLALAGIVGLGPYVLPAPTRKFRRAAPILLALVPLVYAGATLGRAQVWSSEDLIMAQELRFNPDSPRMRMTLGTYAIRAGLLDEALMHIEVAERNLPKRQAATIALWRLAAYCSAKQTPPESLFDDLAAGGQGHVEFYARIGLDFLGQMLDRGDCPEFDVERLVDIVEPWLADPTLDSEYLDFLRSRFRLGRLLLYLERYEEADEWVYRAWSDSGRRPSIGVLAFRLSATVEDLQRSTEILSSLEEHYGQGDVQFDRAVDAFRRAMDSGSPNVVPEADSAAELGRDGQ